MNEEVRPTAARTGGPAGSSTVDGMPSFVVLGAQKSASTFLQDQLCLHPDVEIPEGEVRFFEDPFYSPEAVRGLPGLFRRPAAGVTRGIKRPDYLARPEVPARLKDYLPDARLFVVLREPVARAVSSYYHLVRHGFVPLAQIDDAFAALLRGDWDSQYPRSKDVLAFGRYGEQLRRYLEHFAPEQIMLFEQGELIKNPQPALSQAFEHIGVDPSFELPAQAIRVSNKGVYSDARLRLLRTKNRTRFRFAPDMTIRTPRRMTPWGWVYNAGIVGVDRLVLARLDEGRPPALSDRTRSELSRYYAMDAEILSGVLGEAFAAKPAALPWL